MMNPSNRFERLLAITAIAAMSLTQAMAQQTMTYRINDSLSQFVNADKNKHAASEEELTLLDEMNFIEMVNSVPLDSKSADLIRKFQEKEGRNRLFGREFTQKSGCTVETYRNKEVLLVTIPAANLFAPNDTVLRQEASVYLAPFKRYLKDPDMYRVLMVMHTDNTGSETYRDKLTEERSKAIADWYADSGSDTTYLFPYAFGDDMPLVENNSMSNREKNRRLEVYLVPGKKMLEQAKKGRIVF
ncbi:MAG: OmpA family protein [Muribaculaceae bacterium]|nr:OmpA family protein [Muribaculaceae bacterium]